MNNILSLIDPNKVENGLVYYLFGAYALSKVHIYRSFRDLVIPVGSCALIHRALSSKTDTDTILDVVMKRLLSLSKSHGVNFFP